MTAQNTPGPWVIYQNSICTGDGTANEIAKLTRYGVWMNGGSPYGAHNPIGDANARLIAAAPELLKALEDVVYAFDEPNYGDLDMARDTMFDPIELARAVIAKAKGA